MYANKNNGEASAIARDELHGMVVEIGATQPEFLEETVRLCAQRAGEMVGHGLLERGEVADAIWEICVGTGLVAERGPDAVQKLLGESLNDGSASVTDAADQPNTPTCEIIYRCANSIPPENVDWLWPSRFPRGKFSLLGGHPDEGKTLIAINIVATVSTGGSWPDGTRAQQGNVIILSAEDDAADTIVPRLIAAGADLSRCYIIDAVREISREAAGEPQRVFSLIQDLQRLERLIENIGGASLIIVDVIDSYLGATDSHKNAAVRGVLAPLKDMAARCRVAVIGLTHFSKQGEAKAVLRFTGSIAFIGQARAGWIATPELDEAGEPTGRKLFLKGKNNLAPDVGGLAYRIEGVVVGDGIKTARVVWDGTVTVTADEALAPIDEDRGRLDEAIAFVRAYLADSWRSSEELIKAAKKAGIAERTLNRARSKLKVKAMKSKVTGNWVCALPEVQSEGDREGEDCQDCQEGQEVHVASLAN